MSGKALYHDLGKLAEENQKELHKEGIKSGHLPVNHVDAGAAFLKTKGQEALCSLILVYAHHQGLPDFTVEENRAEMVCYRDTRESVRACFDREMEQLLQIHRQLIRKATYIIRSIVKVICPCSFEWYFHAWWMRTIQIQQLLMGSILNMIIYRN